MKKADKEVIKTPETTNNENMNIPPIVINPDVIAKMSDRDKRILFASLLTFISNTLLSIEGIKMEQVANGKESPPKEPTKDIPKD